MVPWARRMTNHARPEPGELLTPPAGAEGQAERGQARQQQTFSREGLGDLSGLPAVTLGFR